MQNQSAEVVQLFEERKLSCCKCEQLKPISEFNKDKSKKHGFTYRCKDCISSARRTGRKPNSAARTAQISEYMKLRHAVARAPVLALMAEEKKACTKCKEIKSLSLFTKDAGQPRGYRSSCKDCNRAYYNRVAREYFHANKEKISSKAIWYNRKSQFGLTREKYFEVLSSQNNACAICKKASDKMRVDHNHETGKFRGLLCHKCNSGIGLLGDNVTIIKNAAEYLEARGSYGKT